MDKKTIKLTESELNNIIQDCINEAIMDEGLGDQLWQGTKSFFGKGDMGSKNYQNRMTRSRNGRFNLGKRWNAAKTNFQSQGTIDNANEIVGVLQKLIDSGICTWETTLGEVWGKMNQQKAQATRRGSSSQNAIYK